MDLYETLGVEREATLGEIKKAYRKKAMKLHPDREGGDEGAFKALQEAYDTLSDDDRRAFYNRYGSTQPMESVMDKAKQRIASLFTQVMGTNVTKYDNLVLAMISVLDSEISVANGHCKNLQIERRKALLVSQRLVSCGKDSLLLDVLRSRRLEVWRAYRTMQENIKLLGEAKLLMADYDYVADKRPTQPMNHFTWARA